MKTVGFSCGLLVGALCLAATVQPAIAQLGKVTSKVAVHEKVMQVLKEGLLISGRSGTYLVAGHPRAKQIADDEWINCYVEATSKTFKYTDSTGASRTVRVYRYLNGRAGK